MGRIFSNSVTVRTFFFVFHSRLTFNTQKSRTIVWKVFGGESLIRSEEAFLPTGEFADNAVFHCVSFLSPLSHTCRSIWSPPLPLYLICTFTAQFSPLSSAVVYPALHLRSVPLGVPLDAYKFKRNENSCSRLYDALLRCLVLGPVMQPHVQERTNRRPSRYGN